MDEKEIIKEILEGDPGIKIVSEAENIIYFELWSSEYGIRYYSKEQKDTFPCIVIRNYDKYDYPHIMTYEFKINDDVCRSVCLFERDKVVGYLYSYEEKIIETLERLKQLLQLSDIEREIEFQKEFLYYWARVSKLGVDVFLGKKRCFQKLNLYQGVSDVYKDRFLSSGIKLNNFSKYKHVPNVEGFYIPITDNRKILPPVEGKPWTNREIKEIIDGIPYSRISKETYEKIGKEKSKAPKVLLVFEMIVDEQNYNFGVLVEFTKQNSSTLLNRLQGSIKKITPTIISRCDYYFLNKQIGNDVSLVGKRVAIIGSGSLGSYIADDLAKAGVNHISLYDDEKVDYANVLRHKAEFYWEGYLKTACMKSRIESTHPEIFVEMNGNISVQKLKDDMNKFDMIIFAVGSSDVQLMCNKVFMDEHFDKPVMYVWLETGGVNSHILTVDYSKNGCFECLFTDDNGNMVNNKVNKLAVEAEEAFVLRNGCGATRVSYGTSILLRTTGVVLDTVQKIFDGVLNGNSLIDIEPTKVIDKGTSFAEGKCKCCGNRNSK